MKNLVGKRYGMLTVTEYAYYRNYRRYWRCKCDCGNEVIMREDSLAYNRSCGCQVRAYKKPKKTSSDLRLRRILTGMKRRCFNPNDKEYKNYGGRGITVCKSWTTNGGLERFRAWAYSNGYDDSLSIDRINNDGNYSPQNCRWATPAEQNRNRRQLYVKYCGEKTSLTKLSEITGIKYATLLYRYHKGWRDDDIVNTHAVIGNNKH